MIGFWCELNGYWNMPEPETYWSGMPDEAKEPIFDELWLQRNKIPKYRTDDYMTAAEVWFQWTHGFLPNGVGWANEPAIVNDIINIFSRILSRYKEIK